MRTVHATIFLACTLAIGTVSVPIVNAQCQICTLVVGAGVGLSRWLGIDDTISGVWVGGLMVSLVLGTVAWVERKGLSFAGAGLVTAAILYVSVLGPLYYFGVIGQCANKLWGMDKLVIGIVAGSVLFYLGTRWYQRIKRRRGHAYFPFQKVVMPIAPLIIVSGIFYYLVK